MLNCLIATPFTKLIKNILISEIEDAEIKNERQNKKQMYAVVGILTEDKSLASEQSYSAAVVLTKMVYFVKSRIRDKSCVILRWACYIKNVFHQSNLKKIFLLNYINSTSGCRMLSYSTGLITLNNRHHTPNFKSFVLTVSEISRETRKQ